MKLLSLDGKMREVEIYKGVIITENKAFQDRIWYEFVFSNSNNGSARGCFWMVLT